MPGYLFFLSYARLDRDKYLDRFYQELVSAVGRHGGRFVEPQIGFFDGKDIEPGDEWPQDLAEGLGTSRVFVSLYSPNYFDREYCGKEWQVFSSRLEAYATATAGQRPPLIIPVLWTPLNYFPKTLPDAISDIQYRHDDFGNEYATVGLWQLRAQSRHRDRYKDFVEAFAKKLIQAAQQHPLQPMLNLRPIKEIESAFHPQIQPVPVPAQKSENVGPRYVQFVFVAGRRDELQALRQKLDFYGDEGGLDWHPYLPEVPEEVAIIAQEIASSENLRYEVIKLDANIIAQIREAERNNKLVVVIVDTWTLRIQWYYNIMRAYDQNTFLNAILVILWNTQDDETENNRSTLDDRILYTFPSKATPEDAKSALETMKISSANHLKKELSTSLNKTRLRIINIAEVIRKVEGEQIIPTISAS